MNILIPMAGEGKRFSDEGYTVHKPVIPTLDRRTGKKIPMVVAATMDLPGCNNSNNSVIYVDRDFHKRDGIEETIKKYIPRAKFITIDKLTEGQASTCLLAKDYINSNEELLIAGCDNGMVINNDFFYMLNNKFDCIVFTYRNNPGVLAKPDAHGWAIVDNEGKITKMSVKKAISDNPLKDHTVVATFWFKTGKLFVEAAERMIKDNDRINNEFYVDQVIQHVIDMGYSATVMEVEKYIGWGTPKDYEEYMLSFKYWYDFLKTDKMFNNKE